ncbi:MAG: tRNA dimethylallyltransferase [Comamonadaceae bacterium]|nr:MAG: tRNA dimethylallyltransferase [Comamonadaceae bacterium]
MTNHLPPDRTNHRQALPRYLALAGPTASGKTAAALAIAQRWPVEIISVDSALVYRGMDIGSAKPSAAELAAVPHHLINIRDPLNAYSAAEFALDARRLMSEITARGKLPLLVGGTMLYFKALRDGLDDMPPANPALRGEIEQQAASLGWPALHAELAQVDPITAARLNPADSQRISRALEVYRASGQPLSSFHTSKKIAPYAISTGTTGLFDENAPSSSLNTTNLIAACAYESSTTGQNGIDFPPHMLISLEPQDRAWLHQRIAQRFDDMLNHGFLDEVKALRARGDLQPDLPSMRCVGYRQAWEALDGLWPMSELRDKGIAATRQLAKRQITWLRSMPEWQVVACDAPDALAQVITLAADFLQRPSKTDE